MSQTHRDGTAGALLWPNPLGAAVQNDVNHRPSHFFPRVRMGHVRRAGLDQGICRAEPLSPELRRPCCQSWHVAGRLNGIPRRTACGLALTPLPTHFRGSAEEGRLSLGRSPGAALDQTTWQHRLAAAFPRPRCPQRGSPFLQADFTELSVNARAARTKHGCSRTSLFVPLAVPPPY